MKKIRGGILLLAAMAAGAVGATTLTPTGGDSIADALDGSGDKVHFFTETGVTKFFSAANASYEVEYLVVGGGGGSANDGYSSGGGGGGQVVTGKVLVCKGQYLACTVGAGGVNAENGGTSTLCMSTDGSTAGEVVATALGGGYGAVRNGSGAAGANGGGAGGNDGTCGSGGAANIRDKSGLTVASGFPGGKASPSKNGSEYMVAGGGGGSGGAGADGVSGRGGDGGAGVYVDITGEDVEYGGGGGGSGHGQQGGIGHGGGGNGKGGTGWTAAAANRGGGAGGTKGGATGGSGVIILRCTPVSGAVAASCSPTAATVASITFSVGLTILDNAGDSCQILVEKSTDGVSYDPQTVFAENVVLSESRSVTVNGLMPSTEYFFRFTVTDQHDNSNTEVISCYTTKLIGAGGNLIYDAQDGSGDKVHQFNTASTIQYFTGSQVAPLDIEYLVVGGGGGGGGGSYSCGGGGGGGVVRSGRFVLPAKKYLAVYVGAGGAAGSNGETSYIALSDDGASVGTEIVSAMYGGGGGAWVNNGKAGGNGGGAGGRDNSGTFAGGASIWLDDMDQPLGNAGGGSGYHKMTGGGGGGAGGPGTADGYGSQGSAYGGDGGPGVQSSIIGLKLGFGGGGGGGRGGSGNATGPGLGFDGGGNGGNNGIGAAGLTNRGGGGGGTSAVGGSGIVILRYTPVKSLIKGAVSADGSVPGALTLRFSVPFQANSSELCTLKVAVAPASAGYGEYTTIKDGNWNAATETEVTKTFSDLTPGTTYKYRALFADASGNQMTVEGTADVAARIGSGGTYVTTLEDGSLVHIFNSSGVFVAPPDVRDIRYLVVGGGGGTTSSDTYSTGGGGGGGVLTGKVEIAASKKFLITIGAGGVNAQQGGTSSVVYTDDGTTPGTTLFAAPGGGYGGARGGNGAAVYGGDGANGGGGGGYDYSQTYGGKSNWYYDDGITPRGFSGGRGGPNHDTGYMISGGGGGAGGPGEDGCAQGAFHAGDGGPGIWSDITGENLDYGGGGGGAAWGSNSTAGKGRGGGRDGTRDRSSPTAAVANRGGGGGGSAYGSTGGSGVVVLRYFPYGYPAAVTIKLLERGPGFLKVETKLLVCGEGDSAGTLKLAWGADLDSLCAYQTLGEGLTAGATLTNLVVGLEAESDLMFSAVFTGKKTAKVFAFAETFTTDAAIVSELPVMNNASVTMIDAANGIVCASCFVPWGGNSTAKTWLELKYGRASGEYKFSRVITEHDLGTLSGSHWLRRGTWYCKLVLHSETGDSVESDEFTVVSNRIPRDGLIVTFQ